jgi:hypothetical protein
VTKTRFLGVRCFAEATFGGKPQREKRPGEERPDFGQRKNV